MATTLHFQSQNADESCLVKLDRDGVSFGPIECQASDWANVFTVTFPEELITGTYLATYLEIDETPFGTCLFQFDSGDSIHWISPIGAANNSPVLAAIGNLEEMIDGIEIPLPSDVALAVRENLQAEIGNLDAKVSSRSTLTAEAVWTYSNRLLTGFGSLVSDVATGVWGATTRTLSEFGYKVELGEGELSEVAKEATLTDGVASLAEKIDEIKEMTVNVDFTPVIEHGDIYWMSSENQAGAFPVLLTIKGLNGELIPDCDVVLTSSNVSIGVDRVWAGRTDVNGVVSPDLDAGTYFGWCQKVKYRFSNPFKVVVAFDGSFTVSNDV